MAFKGIKKGVESANGKNVPNSLKFLQRCRKQLNFVWANNINYLFLPSFQFLQNQPRKGDESCATTSFQERFEQLIRDHSNVTLGWLNPTLPTP